MWVCRNGEVGGRRERRWVSFLLGGGVRLGCGREGFFLGGGEGRITVCCRINGCISCSRLGFG